MADWHELPIFVYGTLKRNQPNFHVFEDPGNGSQKFLGTAVTVQAWPLIVSPPFYVPFFLDQPGTGHQLTGELFTVDKTMLRYLDHLEHHPDLYTRETIEVTRVLDSNDNAINPIINEFEDLQSDQSPVMKCQAYVLKNFKKSLLELQQISQYDHSIHGQKYVISEDDDYHACLRTGRFDPFYRLFKEAV